MRYAYPEPKRNVKTHNPTPQPPLDRGPHPEDIHLPGRLSAEKVLQRLCRRGLTPPPALGDIRLPARGDWACGLDIQQGAVMGEDIAITRREDYLHVEFAGEFSVVAANRTIDLMLNACAEHQCSRVVMDCRKMTGQMPLMGRFEVAVYAGMAIGPGLRIALLGRRDQVLPGNYFVESVARLRGVDVREFFNEEHALGWLIT